MSANIIKQKSADGQVTRSFFKRPQRLIGVSVLTGLMMFLVSERSRTAYASELTNASQKTMESYFNPEYSQFSLSPIEYLSYELQFSEEDKQLHTQTSSVNIDDSITFANLINLEQKFLAENQQLKSQTEPVMSEDSFEVSQASSEEDELEPTAEEDELEPTAEEDEPEPTAEEDELESPVMFGDKGTNRWYIQAGAAVDIESENNGGFGLAGAGLTHFFLNGHSVNLELNGLGFLQDNDDAVGVNLALIMRWHVLRKPNWSLYVDGGAGLIGTTNSVPSSGSQFNFTPQVGAGTTIRVADQKHLMLGLRWHHISNADLYDGNPGFDALMGYVGLNFPF